MSTVKVKYIGLVRRFVPSGEETVCMPVGATIRDLLKRLVFSHGNSFRDYLIFSTGELRPYVCIMLDGHGLRSDEVMETKLPKEGEIDIVVLAPIVEGG